MVLDVGGQSGLLLPVGNVVSYKFDERCQGVYISAGRMDDAVWA